MHSAGYNFNPKIGIHFGKMIIGTVGVEDSLHETIISETVNTASRIQEQCDCQKIIISESAEENLSEEFKTSLTLTGLEPIYVKGKEKPLKLYELNKKKNSKKEDK
jgi:adenylate cyclase